MTASVLQERASDSSASGASIVLAFASNLTAGSALHVVGSCDTSTAENFGTCTDTANGSLGTILNNVNDSTNNQRIGHFSKNNSAGGADTVTLNFTGNPLNRAILIAEIGGVTTTALDGNNANSQLTPGTGADGVVSSTAANAVQPVLMHGAAMADGGANTPTKGTNFTLGINGWTFGGANNLMTSENQRFTNTTAKQATWTAAANSGHISCMAMYDESAGVAAAIRLRFPWGGDSAPGVFFNDRTH